MRATFWGVLVAFLPSIVGCGDDVDLGHSDDWVDFGALEGSAAEPQTLLRSHEQVFGLTADDATLYALVTRGNSFNQASSFELVSCPIEACKSQRKTLYSGLLPSDLWGSSTLTLVGGWLFWVFPDLGIASCPAQGCSELQITPAAPGAVVGDEEHIYWVEAQSALMRLAPGKDSAENVRSFPPLNVGRPMQVSAHGSYFHFVDSGGSTIYRLRKDGTTDPEPFIVDENIAGIGVSGEQLYYSSSSLAGRIAHCNVDDCRARPKTLADQQRWPGEVRVDRGDIFWLKERRPLTHGEGALLANCELPDCASVDFRILDTDSLKEAPSIFAISRKYLLWVVSLPTSGTALELVPR